MHSQSKLLIQSLTTHPDEEEQDTFEEQELRASLIASQVNQANLFRKMDMSEHSDRAKISKEGKIKVYPLQQMSYNTMLNSQRRRQPLEQFNTNHQKIQTLSQKLDQLYKHYRQKQASIEQKKQRITQIPELKQQNDILSKQIGRIKKMVKDALLVRERNRHSGKY